MAFSPFSPDISPKSFDKDRFYLHFSSFQKKQRGKFGDFVIFAYFCMSFTIRTISGRKSIIHKQFVIIRLYKKRICVSPSNRNWNIL